MSLANCRQCGDLFHTQSSHLQCPGCLAKDHGDLESVREYVRTSQARSVPVIAEATGIPAERILQWLREHRLIINVIPGELRCCRCGGGVRAGRFCRRCQVALAEEILAQRNRHKQDTPAPEPQARTSSRFARTERDARAHLVAKREKGERPDSPPSGMHLRG